MIIRFFLFSLLVAGFVLVIRAIVAATRHLETRQIEEGLLIRDAARPTSPTAVRAN